MRTGALPIEARCSSRGLSGLRLLCAPACIQKQAAPPLLLPAPPPPHPTAGFRQERPLICSLVTPCERRRAARWRWRAAVRQEQARYGSGSRHSRRCVGEAGRTARDTAECRVTATRQTVPVPGLLCRAIPTRPSDTPSQETRATALSLPASTQALYPVPPRSQSEPLACAACAPAGTCRAPPAPDATSRTTPFQSRGGAEDVRPLLAECQRRPAGSLTATRDASVDHLRRPPSP